MEQHPIPQQISSYQFRLVGDMTLKQFFQLAGGLLVALIFYSTPIIGIIKWPFVIVSAILGVALAFLPLEERPLEKWIFAFFRAIYSPTEFFWKKTVTLPKFYQDEVATQETSGTVQTALNQYLSTATQKTASSAKLEGAEKGFLSSLTNIVSGIVTQATGGPIKTSTIPVGIKPLETPIPIPQSVSGPTQQPAKTIAIPQTVPIKISTPSRVVVEEKQHITQTISPQITTHQVSPLIAGDEIVSTRQAIFSIDAAPPNPPTTPNVVVGQVVDQTKRIIEGAIMEIKDAAGRPIRALRSNKVGHFITVTPLENGRYDIVTEKDGYQFVPISFEAAGQIIPPILVEGKKVETVMPQTQQMNQTQNQFQINTNQQNAY